MIAFAIRLSALICVATALAACAGREQGGFDYAYADRYALDQARVERFDVGSRPTPQGAERIARIGHSFVRSGSGKIVIFVPQTGTGALSSGQWVKQELIAAGVAARHIQWDTRPLPIGTIRVAFSTRGADGQLRCTNLGEDVQQFENQTSYLNRETRNFGCAYNANLHAQADNPNDFIRPRQESVMDPVRAANAVRQRRTGSETAAPTAAGIK